MKFQGDILNFCDFIQVFVFTSNHHLKVFQSYQNNRTAIENTFFFADCGNLTAPADGSITFSRGTTFQSVASFDCNTGYTLEGDATRTCQANAAWSNSDPSCKIIGKFLGWIWVSILLFFIV